jgi:hypothetical protein
MSIIGELGGAGVLTLMSTTRKPYPEYLTPEQVASVLCVSVHTVARQFGNMEGVIDLGTPETMHKRRKRMLRIPRPVLYTYLEKRQVKVRRTR